MKTQNVHMIRGRVAKIKLESLPSGTPCLKLSVVTDRYKLKPGADDDAKFEDKYETINDFHNVVVYGAKAERMHEQLPDEGQKYVYIEGHSELKTWKHKEYENITMSKTLIVANDDSCVLNRKKIDK